MIRHIAVRGSGTSLRTLRVFQPSSTTATRRRHLVTSAQKRALDKSQLEGTAGTAAGGESAAASGAAAPPAAGGTAPASGGGGRALLAGGGALAAGGLGYAYYFDMVLADLLPFLGEKKTEEVIIDKVEEVSKDVETADKLVEEVSKDVETVDKPVEEASKGVETADKLLSSPIAEKMTAVTEDVAETKDDAPTPTGRVTVENMAHRGFPPKTPLPPPTTPPPTPHPDGHRVTPTLPPSSSSSPTPLTAQTARDAAAELSRDTSTTTSHQLQTALQLLRADLDTSFLSDLDSLSPSELKIRLVRLASEVSERARYEALRTRELLSLKEKEVTESYVEILQRQRLEFEELISRRLREQEGEMGRRHDAVMREKEAGVKSLVDATVEALQEEHAEELKVMKEEYERSLSAKYESQFKNQLAQEKKDSAEELQGKVRQLETLAESVEELMSTAAISREFESSSQRAHRISAAALALSQRLESNKEAVMELAALKGAVGSEGVIAQSLSLLPSSVKTGVPTLVELQSRFPNVYTASRQAAMVPDDQIDLTSQLLGRVFAKLTVPPSPAAVAAVDDNADAALSVAKYHIAGGNLEEAVKVLGGLKGQVAFTVRDWKRDAEDRIRVEKVLKAVKMECALLNQSMGGGGESQ